MANCRECSTIFYPDETPDPQGEYCFRCWPRLKLAVEVNRRTVEPDALAPTILLTTETAHNLPVTERLGLVSAECIVGVNALKDMLSIGRDFFGGRSETLQSSIKDARTVALDELCIEALGLGANAIVGVSITHTEISGGGKSMLMVAAVGTAVRLG